MCPRLLGHPVTIVDKETRNANQINAQKDVLISSYEPDALFLTHLYELLSVVC